MVIYDVMYHYVTDNETNKVIMQFLFNEMDMSLGPCPLSDNASSLLFKYGVQDLSPGYRVQPFPYLTYQGAFLTTKVQNYVTEKYVTFVFRRRIT